MTLVESFLEGAEWLATNTTNLFSFLSGTQLPTAVGYIFIILLIATLVYFGLKFVELILRYMLYISWAIFILALVVLSLGG